MAPNPKYIQSYQPEKRHWIDRIMEAEKLDLVFYTLLVIIGASISAVALVWVLFQTRAIWGV